MQLLITSLRSNPITSVTPGNRLSIAVERFSNSSVLSAME